MAQPSQSLFRRIRCIKSSLDSAEQSFLDNQDIRGELDLMLAEAELKNLRKKKDVPWNWSRHLFAVCAAVLLVLSGFGGWYIAKGHYKNRQTAAPSAVVPITAIEQTKKLPIQPEAKVKPQVQKQVMTVTGANKKQAQVTISKSDMHKLVQSARAELSSSK